MTAAILFATGGSGGIGKSNGARWTAQFLARLGMHVVLVDGNPGQQSQRAYLEVPDSYSLEDARLKGLRYALVPPRRIGTNYALLAGPIDPNGDGVIDDYFDAIAGCARMADAIVVDADRTDERQWNDPRTFSGGVMRPMVEQYGARILFRVGQTGSQLDDGLAALAAIARPEATLGIGVAADGVKPFAKAKWEDLLRDLARFGGVDRWDQTTRRMIDRGEPGFEPGGEPQWLISSARWAGADVKTIKRAMRARRGWSRRR